MDKVDLTQMLRAKAITPQAAVEMHELEGFIRIGDVPLEKLRARVLDCGFPAFNEQYLFKEGRGELIIVGARTSAGKSAMVMQIAQHVASQGKEVVVYSSEMSVESLTRRTLAGKAGVSTHDIMSGRAGTKALDRAHEGLKQLPITLTSKGCRNIQYLCNTARALHRHKPLSLIVVDYIQNITQRGGYNRSQEIGKVSMLLRELAVELSVPVLAAAQLNRQAVNREHKEGFLPDLADLKDSGEIEQDADAVVLISRSKPDEADIVIAKARDGRTGHMKFKWDGPTSRFSDPSDDSL
jgi:replicative DNA helicase